jgi:hypothetical protein
VAARDIFDLYRADFGGSMIDLLAATERRIAHYNFANPDNPPQFILDKIGMKQVVSYEAVDKDGPDLQTKVTIFAVSGANEIYYVEAWRSYASNTLRCK